MDEFIRTAAISPLRQRLIDDMNMRRFSRETQRFVPRLTADVDGRRQHVAKLLLVPPRWRTAAAAIALRLHRRDAMWAVSEKADLVW